MKSFFFLLLSAALLSACSYHNAELAQRAAAGESAAQYEYGRRLLTGTRGCPEDPTMAAAWLNAAAAAKEPRALATLGLCYERGLGVPASTDEAYRCYEQAAEQGFRPACAELVRLSAERGKGREAAHWLRQLAEGNDVAPQLFYAKLCLSGMAGRGREREAVRYLRFAAVGGSAEACLLLSACYAEGRGVPKNAALAEGWFRNAQELSGAL